MRAHFLRAPRSGGELVADALRLLGAVSIVIAAVGWDATDAGVLAITLPALLVPRFLGLRTGIDIVYGATILVAAWSNVLGLYESVRGWDLVVHAGATGVLTVAACTMLERLHALPPPRRTGGLLGTVLTSTAVGLGLSALWEMVEWVGWRFVSGDIYVTYQDTIGDMMAGGLGAAASGILLARVRVLRSDAE